MRPVMLGSVLVVAMGTAGACRSSRAPGEPAAEVDDAHTLVSGRVLDYAGRPLPHARVLVTRNHADGMMRMEGEPVVADADGRYEIRVVRDEWATVAALGPGHLGASAETIFSTPAVGLDLQLGTVPEYRFEHASVTWLDVEEGTRGSARFEPGADGEYIAKVDATPGALRFWVRDLLGYGKYVGPGCEARGNVGPTTIRLAKRAWLAEATLKQDDARIVCDPDRMPPAGRPDRAIYAEPDSTAARIGAWVDAQQALADARFGAGDYSLSSARSELARRLEHERDPVVRRAALLTLFSLPITTPQDLDPRPQLAQELLETLPPTSPHWRGHGDALWAALHDRPSPEGSSWLDEIDAWEPGPAASALMSEDAWTGLTGDAGARERVRKKLASARYDEMLAVQWWKRDQSAPSFAGRPLPSARYPSLDGKDRVGTEQLAGSVSLVHFWATWCTGCIMEMPDLHTLHDTWGPRGLHVLSINVDDDPGRVHDFRRERFPMPWLNAHATVREVRSTFGIRSFPTLLLVDREGTIVYGAADLEEVEMRLEDLLP